MKMTASFLALACAATLPLASVAQETTGGPSVILAFKTATSANYEALENVDNSLWVNCFSGPNNVGVLNSYNGTLLKDTGGEGSGWAVTFSTNNKIAGSGAALMSEHFGAEAITEIESYFPLAYATEDYGVPLQCDSGALTVTFSGLTPGHRYQITMLAGRNNNWPVDSTDIGSLRTYSVDGFVVSSKILDSHANVTLGETATRVNADNTITANTNGYASGSGTENGTARWVLMQFETDVISDSLQIKCNDYTGNFQLIRVTDLGIKDSNLVITVEDGGTIKGTQGTRGVVAPDNATLTFDAENQATDLTFTVSGDITLKKGKYSENLTRLDFSNVQGDVITDIDLSQVLTVIWPQGNIIMTGVCAAGSADLVPAGKILTTRGDVTVSGDKFAFSRQNVGWVFDGGASTVSGRLVLADAGSATTALTVQNGASLTVNSNNTTEGGSSGDNGAVLFAHYPVATTVMITGEDSLFDVPNGVVNLAKDGNAQVNVTERATFSAYKLNGDTNVSTESVMTVTGATLALGKAEVADGSLKMVEATLKLQDGATLTANGDWAIADGSTAGKIQLSGTVTVRPNGKTITLQKLALATDAEAATLVIDDSEADGYTQGGSVILKGAMPDGLTVKVKNATVQSNGAVVENMIVEGTSTLLIDNETWEPMAITGMLTLSEGAVLKPKATTSNAAVRCLVMTESDKAVLTPADQDHRVAYSAGAYYLLPNGSLTAKVEGSMNWESLTWNDEDDQGVTDPNFDGANVVLLFSGEGSVLAGAPTDVTLASLAIEGAGTLSGALQCGATALRENATMTFTNESSSLGNLLVNSGATAILPKDTVYTDLDNLGTVKVGVITKALTVESGVFIVTGKSTRDNAGGNTVVEANAQLEINTGASIYTTSQYVSTPRVTVRGTLVTGEWNYGNTLGNLGNNAPYVTIDGGTVKFTNDTVGSTTGARGFTVGTNGATLVMPQDGIFTRPADANAYISQSASAGTLTLKGGTYILTQSATDHPLNGKVIVSEGATLKGNTKIATLAFEAETTLDATDSTQILTATTLEMPAVGTVTVKVVEGAVPGTVLLKKAEPAVADAKKFVVGDVNNAYVTAQITGDTIGFVLGRMTTADADDHNPASGSKLANILAEAQAAAIENGITSVNLVYGQCGGKTLTAAQAEAGAELFNNVVTTTTEGATTTVTVAYDFGITGLTLDEEGTLIVKAKVQGPTEGVAFIDGTHVNLYRVDADGSEVAIATIPASSTTGEVTLEVQGALTNMSLGTTQLKVKASTEAATVEGSDEGGISGMDPLPGDPGKF